MEFINRSFKSLLQKEESKKEIKLATAYSLSAKAAVSMNQKKWQDALDLYNNVLALQRQLLGLDHVDVACTLNSVGVALSKLGEKYAAMTAFEEALYIRQTKLGAGHPDAAETASNLWKLFDGAGDDVVDDVKSRASMDFAAKIETMLDGSTPATKELDQHSDDKSHDDDNDSISFCSSISSKHTSDYKCIVTGTESWEGDGTFP